MKKITVFTTLMAFVGITLLNQQLINPNQPELNKQLFADKKSTKQYDKPSEAAAWMASMRNTPKGITPAQINLAYGEELKAARALKTNQDLPTLQFEEIGPGTFAGRIRGFVIHPEREGHLLAGGVSGGIWKSTDDGQSWFPKTDFLVNIAIGSMLIDPDNPERVFAGTGEGFFNFDAAQGNGIFVSEDFGESWTQLAATTGSNFFYVNRLARIPNSDVLLAATGRGIFRSTNLGQSWTEQSGFNISGRGFTDLQMDPSNNNHLMAFHFGTENVTKDLIVTSPQNLARAYQTVPARFGAPITSTGVTGEIEEVDDGTSPNGDGCETISNDLTGKIALIIRGSCNFTVKVANAQAAGAIGAVVYQNNNDQPFAMGGEDDSITIPAVMVEKSIGDTFRTTPGVIVGSIKTGDEAVLNRFAMRSTDAGVNWEILDSHGLPAVNVERMEIGFGSNGTTYVAVSKPTEELADNQTNGTLGLYTSIGNDNLNFIKTASNTNFVERQGWYDLAIAVNPSDPNHVVMGAVDQYATRNAGTTINRVSYWFSRAGFIPQYIHADHHGYFFSPHNSNHIYVVSDGGVAKSEDGGETYIALNNGLNISQSYGIAVSPDGQKVTSGTQDNGSQLYFGDQQNWLEWQGGDGGYSGWDQQQGNFVYGSFVEGQMYGSNNSGASAQAMTLPDTEGARFIQPFVLDENNGNRMLVGTDNVFFTNNARLLSGATWQDVTGSINGTSVSAVAFDPHQSTVAYAGMSNSDAQGSNQIIKITGLGSTNQVLDVAPSSTLGAASSVVTDIKVDTFDTTGNTLYATFGDYERNRILRSTNGGNSWTSISNNLPDIPLFQVLNDPTDPNILYLGSELGLWAGTKSGNTYVWNQFDYGPALTRVIDLVWNNGALYVGTHGRGTYKAIKNPIDLSLVKFIGTNSSCDVDNFLDRGEAGKLMIEVSNRSAKNFNQVGLTFDEPNFISFANANQTVALNGFASTTIEVLTSLDSQASCLADLNIPVTITTDTGTFDTEISLTAAANQTTSKGTFTDGAESGDSLLKSTLALGNDGWIQVTDNVNSGARSWFTTNESAFSDKSLLTPWFTFDGGGNELKFALSYDTEGNAAQYWDGLVLEMRLADSDRWFDIGHLSTVPYDGQLSTNNTARAQFAWSGTRLAWREAVVDLGQQYVGQTAQFRFRMVTDTNSAQEGFWLDDISVSNVIYAEEAVCDECLSADNEIPNKGLWFDPAYGGHGFIIEAVGRDNLFYTMFYTYDDQGNPEWFNSITSLQNGILNEGFAANTLEKPKYDFSINPAEGFPLFADPAITDGRLTINFNSDDIKNDPACQDGNPERFLDFSALVTWKINDDTQTWCIQPLIADTSRAEPDFGTSWYAGEVDTGWGYSLAQTQNQMIAYLFYYDADGNSRWAQGQQTGFNPSTDFTMPMFNVQGYGRRQNVVDTSFSEIGSIRLNLSNTLRDGDTDGSTDINLTYPGTEGGSWIRSDVNIEILMAPH